MATITFFDEGTKDDGQRLGLKGANLCEMSRVVAVPAGFIISTDVSREYDGRVHDKLEGKCNRALRKLETLTHRKFGLLNPDDMPLVLSIRASPTKATPGIMDSLLNIGMNDQVCELLALTPGGSRRFALDTYRQFLEMFGTRFLSVAPRVYEDILRVVIVGEGVETANELSESAMQHLVDQYKRVASVPEDPMKQFWIAIKGIYDSCHAISSTDFTVGILLEPTAIIVQRMVFGNLNSDSGTGVCFSSVVSLGGNIHGNFIRCAEGLPSLKSSRVTHNLIDLGPELYGELESSLQLLETHFHHNFQYVEYTIENRQIYFLETNTVKSNPHLKTSGAYVIDVQSAIDLPEDNELSKYHLLESTEISDPVSQNPIFAAAKEEK